MSTLDDVMVKRNMLVPKVRERRKGGEREG